MLVLFASATSAACECIRSPLPLVFCLSSDVNRQPVIAQAETPPNIPIAGVTPKESPGATTDAAEEPEAGEGGYVKFSQYPHSKNLPQVPCGKAIAPAVPAPNYGRPGWMKAGQKAVVEIKSTARTIQVRRCDVTSRPSLL